MAAEKKEQSLKEKKGLVNVAKFRELGLVLVIIILSIFIQFRNPSFLTMDNLSNMVINTAILSILAVGMMLVIVTRGIDLSIGATIAFSGMIVAQLVSENPNFHPILALLLGTGIGIITGFVIGFLISKLEILPIIATLSAMFVIRGLTFMISDGSWISAHQMPDSFLSIGRGTIFSVNYLVLIAIIIYIGFYYFVNQTRTGRQIYAVGSNPDSSRISGINKDRIILLVYSLMGGLAGLAGVLWVARFASAQGDTATGYEMNVIAACILGGVSISGGSGKVSGVILGSLLIGILNNALPLIGVSPFWQMAIHGFIILFAVIANTMVGRSVKKSHLSRRSI